MKLNECETALTICKLHHLELKVKDQDIKNYNIARCSVWV
jgi:hypothetical protein